MKLIAPHPEPNTTTVFLFGSIAHDSIDDVGSGCLSFCSSTRSNRWFQCEALSSSLFPAEDAENCLFFVPSVVVVLFAVEKTRVAKSASFFLASNIFFSFINPPVELLHDEAKKKSRAAAVVDEIFFALEEDATPLRKEEERSDDMRFGSNGVCVAKFGEERFFSPLFLPRLFVLD